MIPKGSSTCFGSHLSQSAHTKSHWHIPGSGTWETQIHGEAKCEWQVVPEASAPELLFLFLAFRNLKYLLNFGNIPVFKSWLSRATPR